MVRLGSCAKEQMAANKHIDEDWGIFQERVAKEVPTFISGQALLLAEQQASHGRRPASAALSYTPLVSSSDSAETFGEQDMARPAQPILPSTSQLADEAQLILKLFGELKVGQTNIERELAAVSQGLPRLARNDLQLSFFARQTVDIKPNCKMLCSCKSPDHLLAKPNFATIDLSRSLCTIIITVRKINLKRTCPTR